NVIELAQREVVEVVPAIAAIVGLVEAAVAADDHVPAIPGVHPQGVLIGVHAAALPGERKCLAAVLGAVHGHAAHPEIVFIAGIDADLREIHGARVDAVNALPGLAAVGRFVDAAGLVAVGPLLVLNIFALGAQVGGERPRQPVAARAGTAAA